MQVNITPKILNGNPAIPGDKSWIIRYMIVSRIKNCSLTIRNINLCDDVLACMDCLDNLGGEMNCGESATVLRLLLPWCVKKYGKADFILEGNLPNRPMGPYKDIFKVFSLDKNHLHVEGPITLKAMDKNISSQFFSGMLLAGYDMGPCCSKRYFDMTKKVLAEDGPFDLKVPEDITLRAFFKEPTLKQIEDEPDLFMPKAYFAAVKDETSILPFPERIKYKESDRAEATYQVLKALGCKCELLSDSLIIEGGNLKGGKVPEYKDHRIVMMASMLAQYCENNVIIDSCECVSKSWPSFFDEYERLGGIIDAV